MPDLTIVTMHRCISSIGEHQVKSKSGRGFYTVTLYADNNPWCTCPAQRYHRGSDMTCKHIDEVFDGICEWDQLISGGEPTHRMDDPEKLSCPECGGPVEAYQAGV